MIFTALNILYLAGLEITALVYDSQPFLIVLIVFNAIPLSIIGIYLACSQHKSRKTFIIAMTVISTFICIAHTEVNLHLF